MRDLWLSGAVGLLTTMGCLLLLQPRRRARLCGMILLGQTVVLFLIAIAARVTEPQTGHAIPDPFLQAVAVTAAVLWAGVVGMMARRKRGEGP